MTTLNVATWNILSDEGGHYNVDPQARRQESITQALKSIDIQFDAVGLLEVEKQHDSGHHGQNIARYFAGVDGHWVQNPARREDLNIFLGIFGANIETVSRHELSGERSMIVAQAGDVAIGVIHFSYDVRTDKLRVKQARQALDYMARHDRAILMGDFNSASWQRSRKIIEKEKFISVFQALGKRRPATVLTDKYRRRLSIGYRLATMYGFSPDDIYVRGLEVENAGTIEGDSDHRGVWAQIKLQ